MYYPSQPKWIKPAQFQVNPEATENFIRNIAALKDPKGTLEQMQIDQVIKSMANLKTDELSGLYKKYALDAINKYSEASLKLYTQKRGFNRLNLTPSDKLQQDQAYRSLLMDLNTLKMLEKDYTKTLDEVANDFISNIITKSEYSKFVEDLDKRNKEATEIGDIPMAHYVYNNFLRAEPERFKFKDEFEFTKTMFELYKLLNYTEGGTTKRDIKKVRENIDNLFPSNSQSWANLDTELTTRNFYTSDITTEDQKKEFLAQASITGFNPFESHRPSPEFNRNVAGGKNKWKPYEYKDQKTGISIFDLTGVPNIGTIPVEKHKGVPVAVRRNADFSGTLLLQQSVNAKGEPVDVNVDITFIKAIQNAGSRIDPNKTGIVEVPYTKAMEITLQQHNVDVSYFGITKYAEYVPPGYERIEPVLLWDWESYIYEDSNGNTFTGKEMKDAFKKKFRREMTNKELIEYLSKLKKVE